MSTLAGIVAGVALGAGAMGAWLFVRRRRALVAGPSRILFPIVGRGLSQPALDAALRLARADDATLVPAYLAPVPRYLSLDAALPLQCELALPLLEAVEQQATGAGVAVDARIERGRSHRHALTELVGHESYDRIVVAASPDGSAGFTAEDIAWLLRSIPGELVVLRADTAIRLTRPALPAGVPPASRPARGRAADG